MFLFGADGTFDEKEEAILNEFGDWMSMNKEAIYDTRPWKVFGEGPIANADIKINAQGFNEGAYTKATASEIRFYSNQENISMLQSLHGRKKSKLSFNRWQREVSCTLIKLLKLSC